MADIDPTIQAALDAINAFGDAADLFATRPILPVNVTTEAGVSDALRQLQDTLNSLVSVRSSLDTLRSALSGIGISSPEEVDQSITNRTQETTGTPLATTSGPVDNFCGIRFYDGTAFGYLRIFPDKVQLLVDQPYEVAIDSTVAHVYRIIGHNSDVSLYIDGQLVISATGKFNQPTSSKRIEFGDIAGRNQDTESQWISFKYTTSGSYPPNNTEDLLLEQVIAFPEHSVDRLKSYNGRLYAAANPIDPDKSALVYRYEEGFSPERRSVVALTKSDVTAVVIDPSRLASPFDTSGKFIGTNAGLQYILGSKPEPFDLATSFAARPDAGSWTLDTNSENDCAALLDDVLEIDTIAEVGNKFWKYVQRLTTDDWGDKATNPIGWTIEARIKILDDGSGGTIDEKAAFLANAERSCDSSRQEVDVPPEDSLEAPGIYFNDGTYQEVLQFFQNGVRLKYAGMFFQQKLDDQFYTVRLIAKNRSLAVYVKGDNETAFRRVLFAADALFVRARNIMSQEKPSIFSDETGSTHVVWQQTENQNTVIYYNRFAEPVVTEGTGMIGAAKYDPDNTVIPSRVGFGLPPASDTDYAKLAKNILIAPSATLLSDGCAAGQFLSLIGESGPLAKYKIKNVIDELLLELDTPDDLSNIGPASWFVSGGDPQWQRSSIVSANSADSMNPRVMRHSDGKVYVAYDNNEHGSRDIYLRQGMATSQGSEWKKTYRITNSSGESRNPCLAELSSGKILLVWEDSSNDLTGSQIFYAVFDPVTGEEPTVSLMTPAAAHARNPSLGTSKFGAGDAAVVAYEDDAATQNKFEIYTVRLTVSSTVSLSAPEKISTGNGQCRNPSVSSILNMAWEQDFPEETGQSEIMLGLMTNFGSAQAWQVSRLTNSRGSSKHPCLLDNNGVVFQSDRARRGNWELYYASYGDYRLPLGLSFDQDSGLISGTPLETGTFRIGIGAENGSGIGASSLELTVVDSGVVSQGPDLAPTSPSLPLITSPLMANAVLGEAFSYQITALDNGPITKFLLSDSATNASNKDGLDTKLVTYLGSNTRPSVALAADGSLAIVWEGWRDDQRQSIYGAKYDGFSMSSDKNVLAYFPLNEKTGTVVKNRILRNDEHGALVNYGVSPNPNGTLAKDAIPSVAPPAIVGESIFNEKTESALSLGEPYGNTIKVATKPYLRQSGAIDLLIRPGWSSDNPGNTRYFFGNDTFASLNANRMAFGIVPGPGPMQAALKFRIVDSLSQAHETSISGTPLALWASGVPVHLRASWDSASIGTSTLNAMAFASYSLGYACGPEGEILKTADGGTTWTKQTTNTTYDLYSVDFVSLTEGMAVGEFGTVLLTTDGGTTWTKSKVADFEDDVRGVYMVSATTAYAVGVGGMIAKSTDGGATWTKLSSPTTEDLRGVSRFGNGNIVCVGFGVVLKSTDGTNFSVIPTATLGVSADWNAVTKIHILGAANSYVAGSSGKVLKTADNGTTWTNVSPIWPNYSSPNILSISQATNSNAVWIGGPNQELAYTVNGGTAWSFLQIVANAPYKAIEANYSEAGSVGDTFIVSGIGGKMNRGSGYVYGGPVLSTSSARSANLTIQINGAEIAQDRTGDGPFGWDPTDKDLVFGDYVEGGSNSANSAFDEIVIYGTPSPGHSVFARREFASFQMQPSGMSTSQSGKRIEWGAISDSVKSDAQWRKMDMFFCGAKEPLSQFAWTTDTGLIDDFVTDLAIDSSGNLWIATEGGVSKMNLAKATTAMTAYLQGKPQPQSDAPLFVNYAGLANGLPSDSVKGIAVDQNDSVWIGTDNGLAVLFRTAQQSQSDPAGGSTTQPVENTMFSTIDIALPSSNILCVGSSGAKVYVGTDAGLVVIDEAGAGAASLGAMSAYTTQNGLPSNVIQAVGFEKNGQAWIGTNKGLVRFDPRNMVVFNTNNGLVSRDILSITTDKDDKKYIGTGFGFSKLDGMDFTNFPPVSGIGPGAIRDAAVDFVGKVWFATSNGLVEMDENCPEGTRFFVFDANDGIISLPTIRDYERYWILGGNIPTGGCEKAVVSVASNGVQLGSGYEVNPFVPWVIFDKPRQASDNIDVIVDKGWRKVLDFNPGNRNSVGQSSLETTRSKFMLYRKRVAAGTVLLGANFSEGASNASTRMYSVFVTELPGSPMPTVTVSSPTTTFVRTRVDVGDTIYANIVEEIVTLPVELVGSTNIALQSTDAGEIDTNYLEFSLDQDATVYVSYDSRSLSLPKWLRGFEPVPVVCRITDMETFVDGTQQQKLFIATGGSNGCVYDLLNDPNTCDVSDQIALDTTPPTGCATIQKVNSKTSFTMELSATDAVTGVADVQVSPREDGTQDGAVASPFIPFTAPSMTYLFELPPEAAATTGNISEIPPDDSVGSTTPPPPNIAMTVFNEYKDVLAIGTKNPGRVYAFNRATSLMTLLLDTGEDEVVSMATYGNDLLVGTGSAGKSFRWNGTALTQLPIAAGQRVESIWVFGNEAYFGCSLVTGLNPSPVGAIYVLDQFWNMQLFKSTYETAVTSFATHAGRLYWTTSNEAIQAAQTLVTTTKKGHKHFITVPVGTTLLSLLDGTTTVEDGHSHQVVDGVVQASNGHIHGLNGTRSGKIFRFDPATGQPIIAHSDKDYAVTALASSSPADDGGFLFAGTSPNGKILRYVPGNEVFIKSFQTAKLTVNRLRYFGNMYAVVDDDVYAFTGQRWEFVASITGTAHDIAPATSNATSTSISTGSSSANSLLVLDDDHVASTAAAPSLLNPKICAYVRFRDEAGNVSAIKDSDGKLIACYAPCVDLGATGGTTDGAGGVPGGTGGLIIGKSRLLEIDEDGKVVYGLDGMEPFYSGNKVEQEVAVYYSEIFNGTSNLVQWVSLGWTGVTPANTSITIAVRSADSQSGVSSAVFGPEFTTPTGNDLTNMTGQFFQFRATLLATAAGAASPLLQKVDIQLRTSQATHYFTTNFSLPDELRQGLLTFNGCMNPPSTDVVFGISGKDSTEFSEYYIISPDKLFEVPDEHQAKNLRVGIKLISSPTEVPVVDEFALLFSLANDAIIRLNLAGQPTEGGGQISPSGPTRTVITEKVQNHTHTTTFDSTILDKSNINGTTSINAGHQHEIINGVVQTSAAHSHLFDI